MPLTDKQGRLDLTNVQIMNTVRKYAPLDYQQRVPVVTQSNIQSVLRDMNNYMPTWDMFWNVFLGRIGRVQINNRMNFTNPLSELKRSTMRYGNTIQEVQANLIKARSYDSGAENVFGREGREPDIHVEYHTQNRADKYPINIPMEDVLRGSFIEGESISAFFNSLTEVPIASANNDEYVLMRDLTKHCFKNHGFYNIQIPERPEITGNIDEMAAWGVALVRAIRATNNKMRYFQTKYSPEGRERGLATRSNRLIALIDADTEAALKAGVNAYAYNESDLEIIADSVVVIDQMPIDGCYCLLIDEDWYQCSDTLGPIMLQSPLNPDNMSYNYFYHVWQVLSYSLFLGATMFSTMPDTSITALKSTVTGVKLVDAQGNANGVVMPAETLKLFATVEGTNEPNQAVRYEIKAYDGAGHALTLPAECYIDSRGVFHAGNAPQVSKFVIMATSIENETFSATYNITIAGDTYVTKIAGTALTIKKSTAKSGTIKVTVTPDNATQQAYEAVALDDAIAVTNILPDGVEITALGDPGEYNVLLKAAGGDPTKSPVTTTVKVTVQA